MYQIEKYCEFNFFDLLKIFTNKKIRQMQKFAALLLGSDALKKAGSRETRRGLKLHNNNNNNNNNDI